MNYERTKHACGFIILPLSTFILSDCRVSPVECRFTSSDGNPGTNGVITKLAAERGIKSIPSLLQVAIWPRQPSTISSGSLVDIGLFGK